MKTYVISLKYPKQLLNDLQFQGFNPNLVEGVDGSKMSYQEKREKCTELFALFGLPSAIGCALAHKKAMGQFLDSGDEFGLILEDDAVISENFVEHISIAIENVPNDFDILYMDCNLCDKNPPAWLSSMLPTKEHNIVNEYITDPGMALSGHCYILSRKGAEKIFKSLGKIDTHIDAHINRKCVGGEITRYSYNPQCVYQTSGINTENSSMMKNIHPSIIQPITRSIKLPININLEYQMNIATYQICGCRINLMALVFLILGFVLAYLGISRKSIVISFFILSLNDLMLPETYFHLLILLLGFQLQNIIK